MYFRNVYKINRIPTTSSGVVLTTISAEFFVVAELIRLKNQSNKQDFVKVSLQLLYCEVSSSVNLFHTTSSPAGSSDSTPG